MGKSTLPQIQGLQAVRTGDRPDHSLCLGGKSRLPGLFRIFMATFLTAAAVLCAPAPAPADRPEVETVRVLMLPYLDFAPLFIAEEEGYFAEEGLQIEHLKLASSAQAVALLLQGDLDVAGAVVRVNLFNAMARSGSIALVADKGHVGSSEECTYATVVARREWLQRLREKRLGGAKTRVADRPRTILGYLLAEALGSVGQDLSVESRELGSPAVIIEALGKDQLDVAWQTEPWRTVALAEDEIEEWLPANELIPGQQFAVLAFGPRLIKTSPHIGQRFMIAYLKGVRQFNLGKTERNVDLVVKYTRADEGIVREACWPPTRGDGSINADGILEFQRWAVKRGWLDSVVPPEIFWDGRFTRHANEVLAGESEDDRGGGGP